jgi:hypothetical protein
VKALLKSIIGLLNVSVFLLFVFSLFGIIFMQYFSGALYYTCRVNKETFLEQESLKVWTKYSDTNATDAADYTGVCTPLTNQIWPSYMIYAKCPASAVCGSPLNPPCGPALDLHDDGLLSNSVINYGVTSPDNIGKAILTILILITTDSWTSNLINFQHYSSLTIIPNLLCISCIMLGSFFLLNLMLAVIMEAYM